MITEEQRVARKSKIGSSDASSILGLNPFQSAADTWLIKTGRADDFEGNAATDSGNLLEPSLVTFAEQQLGRPLVRNHRAVCEAYPALAANCDAIEPEAMENVEAKSSGMHEDFGTDGSDEVPPRVVIQTHHQMLCLGEKSRVTWVPVILPGFRKFDWKLFRVQRDEDLANRIGDECQRFWDYHVVKDIRPDDFKPSIEVVNRIKREPNKTIALSKEDVKLYQEFELLCEKRKDAEKAEKSAKAAFIAILQDAEAAAFPDGRLATYFLQSRDGYTVKPTEFRQLKVKKG